MSKWTNVWSTVDCEKTNTYLLLKIVHLLRSGWRREGEGGEGGGLMKHISTCTIVKL